MTVTDLALPFDAVELDLARREAAITSLTKLLLGEEPLVDELLVSWRCFVSLVGVTGGETWPLPVSISSASILTMFSCDV